MASNKSRKNKTKAQKTKEEKQEHKKTQKTLQKDEISFDIKRYKNIYSKHSKYIVIGLILIVCLALSVNLRMASDQLPITEEWAENSIKSSFRNQIAAEINSQFPNLPAETRNKMVEQELQKILDKGTLDIGGQTINIEEQINLLSKSFKEQMKTEEGNTYLLAIDPYYYYRLTKNYIETGNQHGAESPDKYYDSLVLAGLPEEKRNPADEKVQNLHVYVGAWTYNIMKAFNPNISIMGAFFYVPVIIGALCIIPTFFITRKIIGNYGGLFAGILMALHPAFLSRTAGGFSDTDAYNLFFPLMALWFVLEAIDAKDIRWTSLWAGLGGLSIGLFSFAWTGWKMFFAFYVFTILGYIGYQAIINRELFRTPMKLLRLETIKNSSIVLGVFILISGIFVTIFKSFSSFISVFDSFIQFSQLKLVGITKIWPNVFTTVAELNPANLVQTFSQISMGSKLLLTLAFIGMIIPVIANKKKKTTFDLTYVSLSAVFYLILVSIYPAMKNDQVLYSILLALPVISYMLYTAWKKEAVNSHYPIILLIWLVGTLYASTKGVRFILIMVPAFSISAGVAVGFLYNVISSWLSKNLNIPRIIMNIAVGGLLLLILFIPVNVYATSQAQAERQIPSMNDGWYSTLIKIRDNSAEDAIINSWWDFGHWFAAIAERPVTLDGGRQNSPQAHWLGKLMLTWDEKESVGILRYLDCGANTGFEVLDEYNEGDGLKSINQVYSILAIDDKDAAIAELISQGVSQDIAEETTRYTHCQPPENYFITSEDMVGKSGVWAHFGAWDFEKASMYNRVNNKKKAEGVKILIDDFGIEKNNAENLYNEIKAADPDQWIAPWPSYISQDSASCQTINETQIICNNGVVFDHETKQAVIFDQNKNSRNLAAFAYVDKQGDFQVIENDENVFMLNNDRSLGAAVYDENGVMKVVLMDSALTASMFTRLFYYENDDNGLKHFEKFHETVELTGQKIIVWKINWEGNTETATAIEDPQLQQQDDGADEGQESIFEI